MPSPIVTAYMDIVPTTRGLQRTIGPQVGADASKLGKDAGGRMGDQMGSEGGKRAGRGIAGGIAASGGLIAGAIAGLAIGHQIVQSIQGAGELEQSVGAIDTVFKENAGQMLAWSDTAAQAVGLSKNSYNEFGTLIGSQLKNAGMPMDEVSGKTNELITLGADLSSMFGGDTSEAVGALSSALKGERDPIERYGVTLTQASIEAKAMEMGLISAGGEMDKQAESAATLALITQQTSDAQGNFGRESSTFQGQLQRTRAQWENMRTELGMKFLPILSSVVGFVNNHGLPAISGLEDTLRGAVSWVRDFVTSADASGGGVAGFFARVRDTAVEFGAWITTTGVPAARALWSVVGPVLGVALQGLGDVLSFVVDRGVAFGSFMLQHRGTVLSMAAVIGTALLAWKAYQTALVIGAAVTNGVRLGMLALRTTMLWVQGTIWLVRNAMLLLNVAFMANPVGLVIAGVAALVAGFVLAYHRIGWFKDGVNAVWGALKVGGAATLGWITGTLWPGIQGALSWIGGAFRNLGKIAGDVWQWAKGAVSGFVSWLTSTALPWVQGALSNVGAFFTGFYRNAVRPAFDGVVSAGRFMVTGVTGVFGLAGAALRSLGGVFSWLHTNAVRPALSAIVGAAQWWWGGVQAVFGLARAGLRVLGAGFTWLIDNAVRPVFRGIVAAAQWWWGGVRAVFALARVGLQWLGDKFEWIRSWASTRFTVMKASLQRTYQDVRAAVIAPFRVALQWLGDKFEWARSWATSRFVAMRDALSRIRAEIREQTIGRLVSGMQWMGDRISDVRNRIADIWGNLRQRLYDGYVAIRNRTIDPLRETARTAQTTFERVQEGIGKAWKKLQDAVKEPVKFVIDKVVNPFIGAYNRANNFWNGDDISELSVGFARGGVLPGYQSMKRDDVMTPMRSGEGVLVPEVVRGLGADFVHQANRAGNNGGVAAVRAWAQQGFAKGGIIGPPLRGNWPISQYPRPGHMAVDIASPIGTPILAVYDGVVTHAGPGFRAPGVWGGNEVHIAGGGYEAWYAHLNRIGVRRGQQVKKGEVMGESGNTGISSGPHLHFGAFKGGYPNELNALDFLGGAFKYDPNAPAGGGSFWQDPLGFVKDRISGFFDMAGPLKSAREAFADNKFLQMPIGIGEKITGGLLEKAASLADPIINAVDAVRSFTSKKVSEKGNEIKAEAWIIEALRATDQFGPARFAAMKRQAFIESGFDPNARNTSAAGIAAGGPIGFMQTVPNTFNAYAMPGRNNILDPVDNGIAAIRYVMDKYGGIENIWPTKAGYALGGVVDSTLFDGGGWLTRQDGAAQLVTHRERKPDAVLSNQQWSSIHSLAVRSGGASGGTGTAEYHFHGVGPTEDPEHYARRSGEQLAHTLRKAGRFG